MWNISPRFLRPHKIILHNVIGEVDGELKTKATIINHCKVDIKKKANTQLTDTSINDTILVVIDVNDTKDYVAQKSFKNEGYTAQIGDIVRFEGDNYIIVSFNELRSTKNTVDFLELICQRSSSSQN